jgi:hypothetical protein
MGFLAAREMHLLVEWNGWDGEIDHLSYSGTILQPSQVTRGKLFLQEG